MGRCRDTAWISFTDIKTEDSGLAGIDIVAQYACSYLWRDLPHLPSQFEDIS